MLIAIVIAPSALITASSSVEIWIDFESSGHNKVPIPLECTKGIARSLDGKYIFVEDVESKGYDSSNETAFRNFLKELSEQISKEKKNEYIFFLVRTNGLSVYNTLLSILEEHNRIVCARTEYIPGKVTDDADDVIKSLPRTFLSKWDYNSYRNELTFYGVMTDDDLKILKKLFPNESSHKALLNLYKKTQDSTGWIDYGTELIPDEWKKVHIANMPNNNNAVTEEIAK